VGATFSGNSADGSGGALYNRASVGTSEPQIINTILWGNTADTDNEVSNDDATPTFSYSIVRGSGGSGPGWIESFGVDGGGNLDLNPQFVDPNGPDDSLGTPDDDLRLQGPGSGGGASPAIDAGDNSADSLSKDLAGNDRKQDVPGVSDSGDGSAPIIDIGAYESAGDPLPVELAGFEGTAVENGVRLTWRTAGEENNAGFRVLRRSGTDGGRESAWTRVGVVDGAGTTAEPQSYRFTDTDLPAGADTLEYRLRQVDTDGSVETTAPIEVVRGGVERLALTATYPNPVSERVTVELAVPDREGENARLELYDVLGRRVRAIRIGSGRHRTTLDVSGLASGMYVLRLRIGGEARTRKLTVVE
jgi:hypothetical protein